MRLRNGASMYREGFDRISQVAHRVGMYFLIAMMLLTVVDVGGRCFFNQPIVGSYELTAFMMAIVVYFCIAYTQVRKGHIRVTFIVDRLPEKTRAVVDSIAYLLGLGMFSLIAWQAALQANRLRLIGETSATLEVPVWPFVWVVAFGSVLLCLVLLSDLHESLAQVVGDRWPVWLGLGLGLVLVLLLYGTAVWGGQLPWQVSPFSIGLFGIGIMLLFMFAGVPIGFAMGMTGFLGMAYLSGTGPGLGLMRLIPYTEGTSYAMSVVPLFILMGMFVFYSGLSRDLYRTAYKWLGHLPGGLAMGTVAACAGFAAVSGSSMATVATMGSVALPEMRRYKYADALATGAVAAGGTIGILIPPSIILIIYGMLTEQSIGRLFMAGIIPGILEALFYIVTIYVVCKLNPSLGPRAPVTSLKEKLASLTGTWQVLVLFVVVIGGIYMGIFTPNEAAGIGAFGALVFALVKRRFTRQNFEQCLLDTGTISAMCVLIIVGAMMFGYFLAVTQLPSDLAAWISELPPNRYLIMGFIILVYIVLGCFMSAFGMILLTIPIFYPLALALGFGPIWFGILIVRMMEMAEITPPYGINLFVIKGVAKDVPLATIYKGVLPFIVADVAHVALLVALPQLVTFLPSLMYGA